MTAPQNVERCLALHPGTYAVCAYPWRHAGRHSFESAAEYTARMLPDYAPHVPARSSCSHCDHYYEEESGGCWWCRAEHTPYGPDNVPRPPHHTRNARAQFVWTVLVLGLIVGVLVAGCFGAFS